MVSSTLEAEDRPRLARQLDVVRERLLLIGHAGNWLSLAEMERLFGWKYPQASISARLRQLRSQGYLVERRRRSKGTHEYRVLPATTGAGEQQQLFATKNLTGIAQRA